MFVYVPDTITGTYTGNSNADGPFVYTGCIPGKIDFYTHGTVWNHTATYPDRVGASIKVDFLSNGFKIRTNNAVINQSGTTYYYTVTTTHDGGEYDGNKVPFNSPAPAVSN